MLEVAIIRWVNFGHTWMHMASNNTQAVAINNAQMVLQGSLCAKETLPTPLHCQHQPEVWTQGRLCPWVNAVDSKCWRSYLHVTVEIVTNHSAIRSHRTCAHSCSLLTVVELDVVFCCCRTDICLKVWQWFWILRRFSAHHICAEFFKLPFWAFLSEQTHLPILLWPGWKSKFLKSSQPNKHVVEHVKCSY